MAPQGDPQAILEGVLTGGLDDSRKNPTGLPMPITLLSGSFPAFLGMMGAEGCFPWGYPFGFTCSAFPYECLGLWGSFGLGNSFRKYFQLQTSFTENPCFPLVLSVWID
jgi:hypothetical protein